ncbi:hypothetical protein RI054_03g15500 [Pseudoscourfieldia marina]
MADVASAVEEDSSPAGSSPVLVASVVAPPEAAEAVVPSDGSRSSSQCSCYIQRGVASGGKRDTRTIGKNSPDARVTLTTADVAALREWQAFLATNPTRSYYASDDCQEGFWDGKVELPAKFDVDQPILLPNSDIAVVTTDAAGMGGGGWCGPHRFHHPYNHPRPSSNFREFDTAVEGVAFAAPYAQHPDAIIIFTKPDGSRYMRIRVDVDKNIKEGAERFAYVPEYIHSLHYNLIERTIEYILLARPPSGTYLLAGLKGGKRPKAGHFYSTPFASLLRGANRLGVCFDGFHRCKDSDAELGLGQDRTPVHEDNSAAIQILGDRRYDGRTKHVDYRIKSVRERVLSGAINVTYISTKLQLADMFTKGLPRVDHERMTAVALHGGDLDSPS